MRRAARLAVACFTALSTFALTADAAPICGANKPQNPIVYVVGTAKPYVAALARALYVDSSQPITIVYKGASSCVAWDAVLNGTPLIGDASYWDPSSPTADNEVTCTIPSGDAGAISADLAVSDIFASSCVPLSNGLPQNVGDFFGPVQTMTFVVPKASSQRAISATAAYFVFGFGNASGVAPWTDEANILRLDDVSGTQRILGSALGVPASQWKGTNLGYSAVMISRLTTTPKTAAEATIGILAATNITDTLRPQISVLAYKHYDQSCAYFPDSTETSKDKMNVRDGHYALWGPIHIASRLDRNGFPINPNARTVTNQLTGASRPPGGLDLIQIAALNNLVPTCAMRVTRSTEVGPLASFAPQNACGCYFDRVATGATSCKACSKDADCTAAAPKCSFGYCETQ